MIDPDDTWLMQEKKLNFQPTETKRQSDLSPSIETGEANTAQYEVLMARFGHIQATRKYSRDEMNER